MENQQVQFTFTGKDAGLSASLRNLQGVLQQLDAQLRRMRAGSFSLGGGGGSAPTVSSGPPTSASQSGGIMDAMFGRGALYGMSRAIGSGGFATQWLYNWGNILNRTGGFLPKVTAGTVALAAGAKIVIDRWVQLQSTLIGFRRHFNLNLEQQKEYGDLVLRNVTKMGIQATMIDRLARMTMTGGKGLGGALGGQLGVMTMMAKYRDIPIEAQGALAQNLYKRFPNLFGGKNLQAMSAISSPENFLAPGEATERMAQFAPLLEGVDRRLQPQYAKQFAVTQETLATEGRQSLAPGMFQALINPNQAMTGLGERAGWDIMKMAKHINALTEGRSFQKQQLESLLQTWGISKEDLVGFQTLARNAAKASEATERWNRELEKSDIQIQEEIESKRTLAEEFAASSTKLGGYFDNLTVSGGNLLGAFISDITGINDHKVAVRYATDELLRKMQDPLGNKPTLQGDLQRSAELDIEALRRGYGKSEHFATGDRLDTLKSNVLKNPLAMRKLREERFKGEEGFFGERSHWTEAAGDWEGNRLHPGLKAVLPTDPTGSWRASELAEDMMKSGILKGELTPYDVGERTSGVMKEIREASAEVTSGASSTKERDEAFKVLSGQNQQMLTVIMRMLSEGGADKMYGLDREYMLQLIRAVDNLKAGR